MNYIQKLVKLSEMGGFVYFELSLYVRLNDNLVKIILATNKNVSEKKNSFIPNDFMVAS